MLTSRWLWEISIHALREEGDLHTGHHAGCAIDISIHALREEGDKPSISARFSVFRFLSTPSARRATAASKSAGSALFNFYPRPPRGGRRVRPERQEGNAIFLSTPSARRATALEHKRRQAGMISIHALREEGDHSGLLDDHNESISIHALREEGDHHKKGIRKGR